MNTKNHHFIITNIILVLMLGLQACVVKPGTWKNERIPSGMSEELHKKNAEVLKHLKANDPKSLRFSASKEFNADNHSRLIDLISNQLTDYDYHILDEYYVVHKLKDTDTIVAKSGDIKRYNLLYPYEATEMYMAYFIPNKPVSKSMISLVYAKLNYGWKLVKLSLAPYTINGQTAPELYQLAKKQFKENKVQAAYSNLALALTCLEPGAYWEYPDKKDAKRLYAQVGMEVNKKIKFPLVLKQLATGPMILNVYTKNTNEGTFPLIYYMTHFDLKEKGEIERENLQIRKVIEKLIPGLKESNKYIFYSAFNKQPTGYVTVDHYDMIENTGN